MHRVVSDNRLVIATHNPGKFREIADLVGPFGINALSAGALGLPEPEETGATFEANAALKAHAAAGGAGLPALADASGLVVPALGGSPGVYSARWAGPGKDWGVVMPLVQAVVVCRHGCRAPFVAVLALPSAHCHLLAP